MWRPLILGVTDEAIINQPALANTLQMSVTSLVKIG